MEYTFEFGNSVPWYFTSLERFLPVKEMGLTLLHLTFLDAKTHLWNMAFLFKRSAPKNFSRD